MTTRELTTARFEPVGARSIADLDGPWDVRMDPEDVGIERLWSDGLPPTTGDEAFVAQVPSILQRYVPDFHGGIAWYERTIDLAPGILDRALRLRIGAADYHATVWWNGVRIGDHEGGFTPFDSVVGGAARPGANRITVRVSDVGRDFRREYHGLPGWDKPTSRRIDGFSFNEIPSGHQDWKEGFEFSGIWQHVELLALDPVHLADVFVIPRWRDGAIDVRIELDNGSPAQLDVAVTATVRPWSGGAVAGSVNAVMPAGPGSQAEQLSVDIADPRAWSVDDPFLYLVTVEASVEGVVRDSVTVRFGLREFGVSGDGYFQLNGERIFIKGAHYQSTEPLTLAYPHDTAMARRIVELAKGAGFNFMRLQLRPTFPAILDAADELGILCMCEPPLSKMHDSDRAQELGLRETVEMIRRDRNRPSIILWLMVNEQADAMNVVHEMCLAARRLDPTRLIMESAGGPSHYYLPGTEVGTSYLTEHYFQGQPTAEALVPYVLDRGVPGQLYFSTEFAVTGLSDDDAVLAAYGADPLTHMEDFRGFVRHRQELQETFERTQMHDVFPTIADFRQATQVFQANSVELLVGGLRANPRLGGYNIVQLADSNANELGGLVDFWRQEPKLAYHRIRQLNEPLNLMVHVLPFDPRSGDPVRVAVTLIDERGDLAPGRLTVTATTVDERTTTLIDQDVTPVRWVTRLIDREFVLDGPTGPIEIRATITGDDGGLLEGIGRATLFAPSEMRWPRNGFRIFDPQGCWTPEHDPAPWGGVRVTAATGAPSLIVAPAFQRLWSDRRDLEAFIDIVDEVKRGSTLVFLGVPSDGPPPQGMRFLALIDVYHALMAPSIVGFEFRTASAASPWAGMVGSPYAWSVGETDAGGYVTDHPVFAGLPGPGLMDWQYSAIIPRSTASMRRRTIDTTGDGIKIVKHGAGRIVFCTFRLLETFGRNGAGERLFANLLSYLEEGLPGSLRDRTPRESEARAFQATQVEDCYRLLARLDPTIASTA